MGVSKRQLNSHEWEVCEALALVLRMSSMGAALRTVSMTVALRKSATTNLNWAQLYSAGPLLPRTRNPWKKNDAFQLSIVFALLQWPLAHCVLVLSWKSSPCKTSRTSQRGTLSCLLSNLQSSHTMLRNHRNAGKTTNLHRSINKVAV